MIFLIRQREISDETMDQFRALIEAWERERERERERDPLLTILADAAATLEERLQAAEERAIGRLVAVVRRHRQHAWRALTCRARGIE